MSPLVTCKLTRLLPSYAVIEFSTPWRTYFHHPIVPLRCLVIISPIVFNVPATLQIQGALTYVTFTFFLCGLKLATPMILKSSKHSGSFWFSEILISLGDCYPGPTWMYLEYSARTFVLHLEQKRVDGLKSNLIGKRRGRLHWQD